MLDDDAAREFIASLKQRIESGEDFAELAKEHSDDIGSAQEGGELGWTNPGQMVPEFETAMAGAEIGVITDPVRSEFGWHILEVTDRRTENFAEQVRRTKWPISFENLNTKKSLKTGSERFAKRPLSTSSKAWGRHEPAPYCHYRG